MTRTVVCAAIMTGATEFWLDLIRPNLWAWVALMAPSIVVMYIFLGPVSSGR